MLAIVIGSKSDLPIFQEALKLIKELPVKYEFKILSAHRTLDATVAYAKEAEKRGVKVIIAAAGASAALPGVISSCTTLPVIGVPIASTCLQGMDALLSMVQMPKNVPVGVVSIGEAGATNAILLALRIISLQNIEIKNFLERHKEEIRDKVLKEEIF
ncbi:MAG: 5-(carboxyamino)imidazole ribonucleotide mutase [Candidatus Fischerbacteria bacterium RBG_13_37_8]|uniref:N5-carboxyaminoimidazole ribonucleotide mutase n=1 Tax=Candidatus Fischerbacteria bacterium RBG_13_37_8 TaxID=1817863 RepID=A0A1F5V4M3_9BACT|nr:MAG: 5-(carboxyamino)imidazole ribonucleotide mutase [Candidatus Fischerbacteria bacterium RBG_13_37_8]